MKSESTIKRMSGKMRTFINQTDDPALVDDAWLIESALLWVLKDCSWTPLDLLDMSAATVLKIRETAKRNREALIERRGT